MVSVIAGCPQGESSLDSVSPESGVFISGLLLNCYSLVLLVLKVKTLFYITQREKTNVNSIGRNS